MIIYDKNGWVPSVFTEGTQPTGTDVGQQYVKPPEVLWLLCDCPQLTAGTAAGTAAAMLGAATGQPFSSC